MIELTTQKMLRLFPETCQGIIWDMDGTLVDSMGMWHQIDVDFLAKRGIPMDEAYNRAVKTMKIEDCARYTIERYHLREDPADIMNEWKEMAIDQYRTRIDAKPGALSLLKRLQDAGVPMALASVSPQESVDASLGHTGLRPYFQQIVDIGEVSAGKESPEIYLTAAKRLGVEPGRCMVCEDSLQGLRTAREAGFIVTCVYDAYTKNTPDTVAPYPEYYLWNYLD